MKAQELRIGNYAKYRYASKGKLENHISQIDGTDIMALSGNRKFQLPFGLSIEPIPLTEEWLLKFGFEKQDGDNFGNYYKHSKIPTLRHREKIDDKNFDLIIWELEKFYWTQIKYVHQLQNLYFALTGEELI